MHQFDLFLFIHFNFLLQLSSLSSSPPPLYLILSRTVYIWLAFLLLLYIILDFITLTYIVSVCYNYLLFHSWIFQTFWFFLIYFLLLIHQLLISIPRFTFFIISLSFLSLYSFCPHFCSVILISLASHPLVRISSHISTLSPPPFLPTFGRYPPVVLLLFSTC